MGFFQKIKDILSGKIGNDMHVSFEVEKVISNPSHWTNLGENIKAILTERESKLTVNEIKILEAMLTMENTVNPRVEVIYEAANGNHKRGYVKIGQIDRSDKNELQFHGRNPDSGGEHRIILTRIVEIFDNNDKEDLTKHKIIYSRI